MGTPYIGEIRMCGFNFVPYGWLACDGQTLLIADYDTLFTLIGTTYGGDGVTTFKVPDLRGRMPVHTGSGYVIGQVAGTETVTLTSMQLPTHNHTVGAIAATGTEASPATRVWAGSPLGEYSIAASPTLGAMAGAGLASVGGNQPHDNMAPYLAINFIISPYGVWPPIA